MIYRVMLNTQNGSIDVDGQRSTGNYASVKESYTEEYLVITDHDDSAAFIYNNASNYIPTKDCYALPTYNSKMKDSDIPVSSISIDRWDENNMKCVPSYGLPIKPTGSYAAWKYTVKYQEPSDSSSGGSSEAPPWRDKYAQNCSIASKEYTVYTAKRYKSNIDSTQMLTTNAVGDTVYRNATKHNYVLSFDFNVEKFYVAYIIQASNTLNETDITVAGIDIPAGCGLINVLNLSLQKWKRNKTYYTVHVEIELGMGMPIAYTEIIGTGYNAFEKAGDTNAKPIHRFTGTLQDASNLKAGTFIWFDEDRKLGSFDGALYTDGTVCRSYEAIQEAMVLNKDGTLLKGVDPNTPLDIDALKDKLNIIKCPEHLAFEWHSLGFPKYGLCWGSDSRVGDFTDVWQRCLATEDENKN